ncbi:MAG: cytochrome c oxidase assembly protein [Gammaproteobacteria bacterium]
MSSNDNVSNAPLIRKLLTLAVAMFGFGFLLVPIYDVFCDITGIGGKVDTSGAAVVEVQAVDEDRILTVEFVTTLNQQAPWEFRPNVATMEIHPGEFYETTFFARNLTDRELVGRAVPSIAPGEATKYLKKTECFCFNAQDFGPEESKDMPVRFVVDRDIPEHIDRITLSYTFFASQKVASKSDTTGI